MEPSVTQNKSISVIVPVYNAELYLVESIESVMGQSYQPREIILVDDGSTDNSAKIARGFGNLVQYHYQPNQGAGAARNAGVKLAQGDFLAFVDADDLWLDDKLALQMQAFDDHPDLEMVFGHVQQFISPELGDEIRRQIKIPAEVVPGKHAGAMLVRRESFFRVGLFATVWTFGEFIDWYARAEELGLRGRMLPEVVMKRRLHKGSQGTYNRQYQRDYVHVLKASLDRRRQRSSSEGVEASEVQ